jgi:hypothetical protein
VARGQHRLRRRVAAQAGQSVGSSPYEVVSGGAASPGGTPMEMPMQRVVYRPTSSQYVALGMEDLAPVWATDGAALTASAAGPGFGTLAQAGNPHPGKMKGAGRSPIAGR